MKMALYRLIYVNVWFPVMECLGRIRTCSLVGGGMSLGEGSEL